MSELQTRPTVGADRRRRHCCRDRRGSQEVRRRAAEGRLHASLHALRPLRRRYHRHPRLWQDGLRGLPHARALDVLDDALLHEDGLRAALLPLPRLLGAARRQGHAPRACHRVRPERHAGAKAKLLADEEEEGHRRPRAGARQGAQDSKEAACAAKGAQRQDRGRQARGAHLAPSERGRGDGQGEEPGAGSAGARLPPSEGGEGYGGWCGRCCGRQPGPASRRCGAGDRYDGGDRQGGDQGAGNNARPEGSLDGLLGDEGVRGGAEPAQGGPVSPRPHPTPPPTLRL